MKSLKAGLLATVILLAQPVLSENQHPELSSEWQSYLIPYQSIASNIASNLENPKDKQERQELYEFIFSQLASGYIMLFYSDPQYPDFWPLFTHAFNQGLPNPDTMYLTAPVDATGIYRVSGYQGSAHIADIQQSGGTFITKGEISNYGGGMGTAYANHSLREFKTDKNGYFEIIFSTEKPAGYQGEWRELHAETTFLFVRQVFNDWENETDSRLAIERLDTPPGRPRPSAQQLENKLKQLAVWTENYVKVSYGLTRRGKQLRPLHQFDYAFWGEAGATTQRYVISTYDLTEDEALIIETDIPEHCLYWNFQTGNTQWRAINPLYHQSSLNGFQAQLDKDGKFRAVISSQDPGVPNWLATGGYSKGEITGRWNECSTNPLPTATKVKLTQVKQYLPQSTPLVSPQQRAATQSKRREALQLRKRW